MAVISQPIAGTRLNKQMADQGLCSRREADEWIARGWVFVNGELACMGQRVQPDDNLFCKNSVLTASIIGLSNS